MYYIGVDIGGTNLVSCVVDDNYNILSKVKIKTSSPRAYDDILKDLLHIINKSIETACIPLSQIAYIGIGSPGTINSESKVIEYSNNLQFYNAPLGIDIEKNIGKTVYMDNDANVAAYGEYICGAAKGTKNAVIITLGTGVGSGIIIDGKIYSGSNFAGGEIGHTVICVDGYQCNCGRKGCFETYSSAGGLIRMTKEAMEKYPHSVLHKIAENDGKISARTAFKGVGIGDTAACETVERYIKHLACGVINVINIFQPEILCIGGGICNEGDNLLIPLRNKVNEENYYKNNKKTRIEVCTLNNDAGIIGAAMLGKMNEQER